LSGDRAEWLGRIAGACERILGNDEQDDPAYAGFLADVKDLLARVNEEREALAEDAA
jgi:hypothetical protein